MLYFMYIKKKQNIINVCLPAYEVLYSKLSSYILNIYKNNYYYEILVVIYFKFNIK